MAFDTSVIVAKTTYNESLIPVVLRGGSDILESFNITIDKIVPMSEYEDMTSSKEINRYVRIKKADMKQQKEEAYELVKVGTTRLQAFEMLSSAKYAFCSISALEDGKHTIIWFSFPSRLYRVFGEFRDLPFKLARELSSSLKVEVSVLSATSFSRNADKFIMYVNGKERNKLSSKGALTEVRDTYGLDINNLMINIDKNMAIHYAPQDYKEASSELQEQEKRLQEWKEHKDEIQLENKEDGTNYIETFEKENEVVITRLNQRVDSIRQALLSDPIGKIVYFKMTDKGSGRADLPTNEREFGRTLKNKSSS